MVRKAVPSSARSTANIRPILDSLDREAGVSSTDRVRSDSQIDVLAQDAWADIADALEAGSDNLPPELRAALARLRVVDQQLLQRLTMRTSTERLSSVVEALELLPCVTDDLITAAPRLICDLGFDRAIISRVENGLWTSEAVYIPDSAEWATEINKVGQEMPQKLGPDILETEIVRRREGLLVTDVQSDGRVNRPIADASKSRSYVAAPIISDGRVVGLLHADKYRQSIDVDADDCQLLIGFAQSFRLALGRAKLAEEVLSVKGTLDSMRSMLDYSTDTVHHVSVRRTSDDVESAPAAEPGRSARPDRTAPASRVPLTQREHEVLALMARGSTNSAIARELVIAEGTVKQHVKHVLRKLQVANRSEAVAVWFNEFTPT
jgi:DNA-binding CsgD family transcriptional regulator